MRIFDKFNTVSKCPICGTNKDKPCFLAGLDGTQDDGIIESLQIHVDCLDLLVLRKEEGEMFLVQKFKEIGF